MKAVENPNKDNPPLLKLTSNQEQRGPLLPDIWPPILPYQKQYQKQTNKKNGFELKALCLLGRCQT
jgi:hypothetical protein